MDPVAGMTIVVGLLVAFAYIYAAAYVTVDTSKNGGPAWLVGLLTLVLFPVGIVTWFALKQRWDDGS